MELEYACTKGADKIAAIIKNIIVSAYLIPLLDAINNPIVTGSKKSKTNPSNRNAK